MVDRLHLLVHRLHFFLGGGQLLVGTLQFFVGRLQFFVGRFEFLLRTLHLFAGGLQLLVRLLQCLLQGGQLGALALGSVPGGLARSFAQNFARTLANGRRNDVGKHHQHHPAQRRRFAQGLQRDFDRLRASIGAHRQISHGDGGVAADGTGEVGVEGACQPFSRHRKNVQVGSAGGRLQVFAGPAADIDDVALPGGEHRRRGETRKQQGLGERLQIGSGGQCRLESRRCGHTGAAAVVGKGGGEIVQAGLLGGFRAPVQPCIAR